MVVAVFLCGSVERRDYVVLIVDLVQYSQHQLLEKLGVEVIHVVLDILHPYIAYMEVEKESAQRAASGR